MTNVQRFDGHDHRFWTICPTDICVGWWPSFHRGQEYRMIYMKWDAYSKGDRTPYTVEGEREWRDTVNFHTYGNNDNNNNNGNGSM